jgi:hypothetical protein|tara:strand:- start:606 stop:1763 length:1158 start_codon:yes stop_codon:yes gene_type:complete
MKKKKNISMSGANLTIPDTIKYKITGTRGQGRLENVPIDIPVIDAQRSLKKEKCVRWLKKRGSFDWRLYGRPAVAMKTKNGQRTNEHYLYDGGHRRYMYKLAANHNPELNPDIFPALVYDIDEMENGIPFTEQVSKYFAILNTNEGSSRLTPDEGYVSQWHGKFPFALEVAKVMDYCDVCVRTSNQSIPYDTKFSIKSRLIEDLVRWTVHPSSIKKTLDVVKHLKFDRIPEAMTRAIHYMIDGQFVKAGGKMPARAIEWLNTYYPNYGQEFRDWFAIGKNYQLFYDWFPKFAEGRGYNINQMSFHDTKIHNREGLSIGYNYYKLFYATLRHNNIGTDLPHITPWKTLVSTPWSQPEADKNNTNLWQKVKKPKSNTKALKKFLAEA